MPRTPYLGKRRDRGGHQILGSKTIAGTKCKNIFGNRFSILRAKKCLATPRVAALQHLCHCDEWNHNSDEWNGKFTIYPLASENE
jgi:hypothetical protein